MEPITTGALIVGGSSLASSLIGGGLSAYGASVGAKQSYTKSKRLMNYQNKLNKQNLLESKELLRRAGYNPILYASNGGNALPAVTQASAPVPDYATGFSQMGNSVDNAVSAGVNFAKGLADVQVAKNQAKDLQVKASNAQELQKYEKLRLLSESLSNYGSFINNSSGRFGQVFGIKPGGFVPVGTFNKSFNVLNDFKHALQEVVGTDDPFEGFIKGLAQDVIRADKRVPSVKSHDAKSVPVFSPPVHFNRYQREVQGLKAPEYRSYRNKNGKW